MPKGVLIPGKRPEEGQGHLVLSLSLHLILWDRVSNERGVNWRHHAPVTLPSLSPTALGYRGMANLTFSVGAGDLNSGFHACSANTLLR